MVMAKILKSDEHAGKLVSIVFDLYGKPSRYCDVDIQVGLTTFKCHKLILAMQSTYFQQCLFPASLTVVQHITLNDTAPEDFNSILRYLYTGGIELDITSVRRIVRLVEHLHLDGLKQLCMQFMTDTLDTGTCVQYWRVARDIKHLALESACGDLFSREFVNISKTSSLQDITEDMLKMTLNRDDLNVNSEIEVCEVLLKWFDENRQSERSTHPKELLSLVRWSGVNVEYIKSDMIQNETLIKDQECFGFMSKVISYRLSGIQFPGLRTRHRTSTGLETCVVVIGVDSGDEITSDSWRVSLQSNKSAAISNIPTEMQFNAVACANNSSLYVTGVGDDFNETRRWDAVGGWTRCADMIQGRQAHCAAFVDNTSMYAFGGLSKSSPFTTLSSAEKYNTLTNKWTTVGQLANSFANAACVAYKTSVYLFGGYDGNEVLDCMQEYNTTTQQCTILTQRLVLPCSGLRAVLCDKYVILMNSGTCQIFDLDQKTVQQRNQFAAGITSFGLALDNDTLFVIGGETSQMDEYGEVTSKCTDQVKCIPVNDVINHEQTVNWTQHAKLQSSASLHAFSVMTLAVNI